MARSIFHYILMGLSVLMNGQIISSSFLTSFEGFSVEYGCMDTSTCTMETITALSDTFMNYPLDYECIDASNCTVQSTTTFVQTTTWTTTKTSSSTTQSPPFVPPTCPNQTIGMSCNVSADPCAILQPCLNLATCHINTSLPTGYMCSCRTGFSGAQCQVDERPCRPGITCLNGGICNETVNVTHCTCPAGKTGVYCESKIDMCANITCQNDAICVSNYGNWSCLCTNSELYSGIYCEIKSSSLKTKEISSRSFSGVAIGCVLMVVTFIIIMDILKYIFKIDPIVKGLQAKEGKKNDDRSEEKQKKKAKQHKQPVVAIRFQYVHAD